MDMLPAFRPTYLTPYKQLIKLSDIRQCKHFLYVIEDVQYRVTHLKLARISSTTATRSGIETAIFVKTAPLT
jgi:hypothetical protein